MPTSATADHALLARSFSARRPLPCLGPAAACRPGNACAPTCTQGPCHASLLPSAHDPHICLRALGNLWQEKAPGPVAAHLLQVQCKPGMEGGRHSPCMLLVRVSQGQRHVQVQGGRRSGGSLLVEARQRGAGLDPRGMKRHLQGRRTSKVGQGRHATRALQGACQQSLAEHMPHRTGPLATPTRPAIHSKLSCSAPRATTAPRPWLAAGATSSSCKLSGSPAKGLSPGAGLTSCSDRAGGRDSTNRSPQCTLKAGREGQVGGGAAAAGAWEGLAGGGGAAGVGVDARVVMRQLGCGSRPDACPASCGHKSRASSSVGRLRDLGGLMRAR